MQQEKINKLEQLTSVHQEKINSLENSLENVKPLVVGLKEVVTVLHEHSITMAKNTASHNETIRAIDRVHKRQDKLEALVLANTNELSAARPVIATMMNIGKVVMYFALSLVTMSLAIFAYIAKTTI